MHVQPATHPKRAIGILSGETRLSVGNPASRRTAAQPGPKGRTSVQKRIRTSRSVCGSEIRGQQPAHGRHRHGREQRRVGAEVDAVLGEDQKRHRRQERADHRHDLAPGVDAPPVPPHQIQQARARANLQDDVERILRACRAGRRSPTSRRTSRTVDEASGHHVVLLACASALMKRR